MTSSLSSETSGASRELLRLALPTFGQLIAEPIFVLIDTAIVGHVGDVALAALSVGSTLILTLVGLCIFLAYATTSQVARLFGEGHRREGMATGIQSLWLGFFIGVILAILVVVFGYPINAALGESPDVAAQATLYTTTVGLGMPGMLIVYAANGIYRGLKKASLTLVAAVCGAILNTILDVIFVIGLQGGILGSGVATLIAQWFMGIFLLVPAIRWARKDKISFTPRLAAFRASGAAATALFLRSLALRIALVGTLVAAASLGTEALAGYQIVNAIWNFAVNVLDSTAIAGQTLVAAALGAHNFNKARGLMRFTAKAGILMGVIVGALFVLGSGLAVPFFTPSPEVQRLAAIGMVVVGLGLPLQGWMWALDGILLGAQDYRYLAATCGLSAAIHLLALFVLIGLVGPYQWSADVLIALLWVCFDVAFMGGRAVANGLRIRTDYWLK